MINEDKLIKALQAHSSGFIGDDAALLPNQAKRLVVTKDLLVEDIHFRRRYFSPIDLSIKALNVNLSDIAAMGAEPLYILCGISIPNDLHEYSVEFLNSLALTCKDYGIVLIGGDTTSSKNGLFISITAIGCVDEDSIKTRNTACANDIICVAGNLGYSHLGFIALEQNNSTNNKFVESFLRPKAKINEGLWFGKNKAITSMMDISDGLYVDLKRLCASSKKGAVIDIDALKTQLSTEVSLQTALEGGEDYGLLITINKNQFEKVSQEFLEVFGYQLKLVGEIVEQEGISFKNSSGFVDLKINSFTHFGEKI